MFVVSSYLTYDLDIICWKLCREQLQSDNH